MGQERQTQQIRSDNKTEKEHQPGPDTFRDRVTWEDQSQASIRKVQVKIPEEGFKDFHYQRKINNVLTKDRRLEQ